jgi:GTP pyrophosphokinase
MSATDFQTGDLSAARATNGRSAPSKPQSSRNGLTEGHNDVRPAIEEEARKTKDEAQTGPDGHARASQYAVRNTKSLKPTLENLIRLVRAYNPSVDVETLRKTYQFAEMAHDGQMRGTGEPYITHPLQVAFILADMHLDLETIQAALLHDTIEDTAATNDDISKMFGPVVANLVEGVTKLSSVSKLQREADHKTEARRAKAEGVEHAVEDAQSAKAKAQTKEKTRPQGDSHQQQAENLRKMFLAMFDDPRVVLIKLADRLHNMRTLEGLPSYKQERIAAQTLEIYAPLANRLGMWQMKGELEDLSFMYLDPQHYKELTDLLKDTKTARDRYLKRVIIDLQAELEGSDITAEIKGRVKHV